MFVCTLASLAAADAEELTVRSGPARTHLVELFTSEGCSSCPPAERWLSTLRQSERLWKEVVPISFHVDYWDNLGWPDQYASKGFTSRQRAYAASWGTSTVYTPGFVLNGAEWRAQGLDDLPHQRGEAGTLVASLAASGEVKINYTPPKGFPARAWHANVALLGMDINSNVKAGENRGRKLVHDFVVLALDTGTMSEANSQAVLHLPADKIAHGRSALAVWITEAGKLTPVQAAGGDL